MNEINPDQPGVQEGIAAAKKLCDPCRNNLNKNLKKIDFVLGPKRLLAKMDKLLCAQCKKNIWEAGRAGARR